MPTATETPGAVFNDYLCRRGWARSSDGDGWKHPDGRVIDAFVARAVWKTGGVAVLVDLERKGELPKKEPKMDTSEQLAKISARAKGLGGYPFTSASTYMIDGSGPHTTAGGTTYTNIYSDNTGVYLPQNPFGMQQQREDMQRLYEQQSEYMRQKARVDAEKYARGFAADPLKAPAATKLPSAGLPKEDTALAWLDSEIDRIRVRL